MCLTDMRQVGILWLVTPICDHKIMIEQLELIHYEQAGRNPEPETKKDTVLSHSVMKRMAPTVESRATHSKGLQRAHRGRSRATRQVPRRSTGPWVLDETTKKIGRMGLAKARAELQRLGPPETKKDSTNSSDHRYTAA